MFAAFFNKNANKTVVEAFQGKEQTKEGDETVAIPSEDTAVIDNVPAKKLSAPKSHSKQTKQTSRDRQAEAEADRYNGSGRGRGRGRGSD